LSERTSLSTPVTLPYALRLYENRDLMTDSSTPAVDRGIGELP
jgi:hypothetical protein